MLTPQVYMRLLLLAFPCPRSERLRRFAVKELIPSARPVEIVAHKPRLGVRTVAKANSPASANDAQGAKKRASHGAYSAKRPPPVPPRIDAHRYY